MPVLKVGNVFEFPLPSLGRKRRFTQLSEKRVTKAVRQTLRTKYGVPSVEVSCAATLVGDAWKGQCMIGGERYAYVIRQNR